MNIFDRLKLALRAFRASPSIYNVQSKLYEDTMIGSESKTTLFPSQENFYKNSSFVYACVKRRMDAVARPPLHVFKRGDSSPQLDHPLQKLLDKPTPFHTRSTLQRRVELALCTWGNALIGIEKNKLDKPVEAWWMRPDGISVVPHRTNFIDHYEYNVGGDVVNWGIDEILHFKYDDPFNQLWGLTPLSAARLTAEFGIDAITSNRYFFKNFAMPATGLVTKEPITETQAKEILARWNEALVGATKQHKALVLGAVDPKPLAVTNKDAEWIAGMKFALDDIARIFGVPSPLVGEEKAVYKNISEAEEAFWHETIIPELMYFEEIYNQFLIPLYQEAGIFVTYDLSSVEALQEDINVASERHERYVRNGIKVINEVREDLGLPPVSWGSVWYMPMNLFPVGKPSDALEPTNESESETQKLVMQGTIEEVYEFESVIANFFEQEREAIAEAYSRSVRQSAYDWTRWARLLSAPLANILFSRMKTAMIRGAKQVGVEVNFDLINGRSREWASRQAAKLLDSSRRYPASITNETRKVVSKIVSQGIGDGKSVNRLREEIAQNPIFGRPRAYMIARTETQRAYNYGNLEGYKASGVVTSKRWIGGAECCDECAANTNQGTIGLNEQFASGDDAPPAHPNCLCHIIPVT